MTPRRNGNEPPVLAILKALTIGGEQRRMGLGSSVQLLYGLLAKCDDGRIDPREETRFRMSLPELANIAGTSTTTVDRWRHKLRAGGFLQFGDQGGKKEATEYVFQCDICTAAKPQETKKTLVTHKRVTETHNGLLVSSKWVSSKENARPDSRPSPDPMNGARARSLLKQALDVVCEFNPGLMNAMDPTFSASVKSMEAAGGGIEEIRDAIEKTVARETDRNPGSKYPFGSLYFVATELTKAAAVLKHPKSAGGAFNTRGMYTAAHDDATESARIKELTGTGRR